MKQDPRNLVLSTERADGRKQIAEAKLLRFKNRTTHRRYVIDMSTPEFTCICPVSGFPDFATLHITFVPKDWCVELKSLKLYINRFRDQGIYHDEGRGRFPGPWKRQDRHFSDPYAQEGR
jgi:7-cyano-7-deazaguanine reductase